MLFQAIQARNWELDDSLMAGELNRDTALEFHNTLSTAIPCVLDIANFEKCLVIFRKWESILYTNYNHVYENKKDLSMIHPVLFAQKMIEQLEFFDQFRSQDITIKKNKNINKYIQEFNKSINPSSQANDNCEIQPIENYTYIKNISCCAESAYKNSNFKTASEIYLNTASEIRRRIDQDTADEVDLYFLSWILHAIGNIFYSCQQYKYAFSYYSHAYDIKNLLRNGTIDSDYLELSITSSYTKVIATKLAFGGQSESEHHEELLKIEKAFAAKLVPFSSINREWTLGIKCYLEYLIGKSYLYLLNKTGGERYLDKSAASARDSGNKASEIRAMYFGVIYRVFSRQKIDRFISAIRNDFDEKLVTNPNIRRLLSPIMELEMMVQSDDESINYYTQLIDIFKSHGVIPLQPNDNYIGI